MKPCRSFIRCGGTRCEIKSTMKKHTSSASSTPQKEDDLFRLALPRITGAADRLGRHHCGRSSPSLSSPSSVNKNLPWLNFLDSEKNTKFTKLAVLRGTSLCLEVLYQGCGSPLLSDLRHLWAISSNKAQYSSLRRYHRAATASASSPLYGRLKWQTSAADFPFDSIRKSRVNT
jgi:hypothetical protein